MPKSYHYIYIYISYNTVMRCFTFHPLGFANDDTEP